MTANKKGRFCRSIFFQFGAFFVVKVYKHGFRHDVVFFAKTLVSLGSLAHGAQFGEKIAGSQPEVAENGFCIDFLKISGLLRL